MSLGFRAEGLGFGVSGSGLRGYLPEPPLARPFPKTSGTIAAGVCQALPRGFGSGDNGRVHTKTGLIKNGRINENYYTNALILPVKMVL